MTRRVGIYSGTFDPVHKGHLAFAHQALQTCAVDEVAFVPEACPRNKAAVSDIEHRVALLRLATASSPHLHVMQLVSQQFSITQTLPELRQLYVHDELTFLLGSDVVLGSLAHWPDLAQLLGGAQLVVSVRQNDDTRATQDALDSLYHRYGLQPHYTIVASVLPTVASSEIRRGNHAHLPNEAIEQYIEQHHLYMSSPAV